MRRVQTKLMCDLEALGGRECMRSQAEWDAFYAKPDPWGSEGGIEDIVRTNTLLRRIQHANFRHALDLGCGEGVLTNELSKL
jgi:hypothetical protein